MAVKIAPSVLACDFGNIQSESEMLNSSEADWFHIDIMDGVFVPNISFGFPVMQSFHKHAKKPLDVHLMIENPDDYLETFKNSGATNLTVHYEACPHLHRTLGAIRQLGMKAGVALNPHTPVSLLEHLLPSIDLVCIMSVNPGFGGQKFIPESVEKVKRLKDLISKQQTPTLIEVDGGVTSDNAKSLVKAGADVLVAGSFVFKSDNPVSTIGSLKQF